MEAMCMGLPVIATALGGSLEQVVDGETGYLVPPAVAEALAEKISFLALDPDRAKEMGGKGKERVRQHFSLEKMMGKIQGIYELNHLPED
jgi:glycosyltransferase involved in cell wall biosynthesis